MGVPQMNVPSEFFSHRLELPAMVDAFDAVLTTQLGKLANVDLLVLTETFDGTYPLLVPTSRKQFQTYARLQHQALLLTSYLPSDDGGIYNAVGSIGADGKLLGIHRKVNLAPFGEVEFAAGTTFQPVEILPNVRIGVLVCQESLLPAGPRELARRGANILISPTSDISFRSGLLSFEHLALARMRAIETGRAMIWASAGGPSGVVDRWGTFTPSAPFRAPMAARMTVAAHDDLVPYLRLEWVLRFGALVGALAFLIRDRAFFGAPSGLPVVSTLRGYAELVVALGFLWVAAISSAGAVEIANGTPERAKQSVDEILHHRERALGNLSLSRFKTDTGRSAVGALSYYLESYGQRATASSNNAESLDDLAQTLERTFGFPSRVVELSPRTLPRSPTLVRTKSGQFGVTTADRAHRVWLFEPRGGSVRLLTATEADAVLEPRALMPAFERALSEK